MSTLLAGLPALPMGLAALQVCSLLQGPFWSLPACVSFPTATPQTAMCSAAVGHAPDPPQVTSCRSPHLHKLWVHGPLHRPESVGSPEGTMRCMPAGFLRGCSSTAWTLPGTWRVTGQCVQGHAVIGWQGLPQTHTNHLTCIPAAQPALPNAR